MKHYWIKNMDGELKAILLFLVADLYSEIPHHQIILKANNMRTEVK